MKTWVGNIPVGSQETQKKWFENIPKRSKYNLRACFKKYINNPLNYSSNLQMLFKYSFNYPLQIPLNIAPKYHLLIPLNYASIFPRFGNGFEHKNKLFQMFGKDF